MNDLLNNEPVKRAQEALKKLDENSAQFILQGFLDYLSKKNTWSDTIKGL